MEQLYFVKVNDTKEDILKEQAQELLARALGISEQSVAKLLERMPGPVTKPISKAQAKRVAENFAKAGISTTVVIFPRMATRTTHPPLTNTKSTEQSKTSTAIKTKTGPKIDTKPKNMEIKRPEIKRPEIKSSAVMNQEIKSNIIKDTNSTNNPIKTKPKLSVSNEVKIDTSVKIETSSEKKIANPTITTSPLDSAALYRPIWQTRLWRKIFSISSTTALVLFFANLAIFWFAIRPILQEQLVMARLEPSLVSSASLSSSVTVNNGRLRVSPQLLTQLVSTIDTKSIDFLVISDLKAKTVTNWHPNFAISSNLEQEISKQAQFAIKGNTGIYKQSDSNGFLQKILNTNTVSIAYQPLLKDSQVVGATIIGISNQAINNLLNRILLVWLALSLIPLALGYIISAFRSYGISKNIIKLGRTADEISRGKLNNEIKTQSNDELQYISSALERLRVSMSEALIRLRRRR